MELPSTWQDWIIAIGQLLFFIALLPSVFSNDKPNRWSSLMTGSVLLVFTFTFWSLDLFFGAFSSALVSITWFILFFQKSL